MMSRLMLLVLWVLCMVAAMVCLVWMLLAIIAGSKRAYRLAFGFDQTANVAIGGHHDEKISSRAHRCGWKRAEALIDALFFFDPEHCRTSFENEVAEAQRYLRKVAR